MSSVANWHQHAEAPGKLSHDAEILEPGYSLRGFLPARDPLTEFPVDSPYRLLDQIGRDLPSLLHDKQFRSYARTLAIPFWHDAVNPDTLPALHLYYLRLGFLASAYINQG